MVLGTGTNTDSTDTASTGTRTDCTDTGTDCTDITSKNTDNIGTSIDISCTWTDHTGTGTNSTGKRTDSTGTSTGIGTDGIGTGTDSTGTYHSTGPYISQYMISGIQHHASEFYKGLQWKNTAVPMELSVPDIILPWQEGWLSAIGRKDDVNSMICGVEQPAEGIYKVYRAKWQRTNRRMLHPRLLVDGIF